MTDMLEDSPQFLVALAIEIQFLWWEWGPTTVANHKILCAASQWKKLYQTQRSLK